MYSTFSSIKDKLYEMEVFEKGDGGMGQSAFYASGLLFLVDFTNP
jgi:hypothetical protein